MAAAALKAGTLPSNGRRIGLGHLHSMCVQGGTSTSAAASPAALAAASPYLVAIVQRYVGLQRLLVAE